MKIFLRLFATVLCVSVSPFAAAAGEKVAMHLDLSMELCQLANPDQVMECAGAISQIKETHMVDLVHSLCTPACTYNDHAQFTKTYVLERPDIHQKLSYDVSVVVSRMATNPSDVPQYDIEVYIQPTGGTRADTRNSLVSVYDLHAFSGSLLEGKSVIHRVGPSLVESIPTVFVSDVQIIQVP